MAKELEVTWAFEMCNIGNTVGVDQTCNQIRRGTLALSISHTSTHELTRLS